MTFIMYPNWKVEIKKKDGEWERWKVSSNDLDTFFKIVRWNEYTQVMFEKEQEDVIASVAP